MIFLIKILFVHFIGDFIFQPENWVSEKERLKIKSPKLYFHTIIHGLLVFLILFDLTYWIPAILIMVLHFIIDLVKVYFQKEKTKIIWFIADQTLHILGILIIWLIWFKPDIDIAAIYYDPVTWIFAISILILTKVSSILIQLLMQKWSGALNDSKEESLSEAGKYIGILERLFVFAFILTGHWEAVGFLLAAKSVFRFGDLKESKDRKLTEYILIGTLLSFGIAIFLGALVSKITEFQSTSF
jgi:hypothetical protein